MAAKAALYLAMRKQGISTSKLARRLDIAEKDMRRPLDPRYVPKLPHIGAAVAALGKVLVVEALDATSPAKAAMKTAKGPGPEHATRAGSARAQKRTGAGEPQVSDCLSKVTLSLSHAARWPSSKVRVS